LDKHNHKDTSDEDVQDSGYVDISSYQNSADSTLFEGGSQAKPAPSPSTSFNQVFFYFLFVLF